MHTNAGEQSGDATVSAHAVFEATLDVTEEHIYGSGGTSICYQFDVQAFDIGFGIWCGLPPRGQPARAHVFSAPKLDAKRLRADT